MAAKKAAEAGERECEPPLKKKAKEGRKRGAPRLNLNAKKNLQQFFAKYTWARGEKVPRDEDERLELLRQSQKLDHAIKYLKKRKRDDKDTETKLEEARRLKKVFIDKAAGLATQLMEGGAVDSEKPEASSHKPWVSLKNEPRGRRRPCPPYTCKADSRAWSRIILM